MAAAEHVPAATAADDGVGYYSADYGHDDPDHDL
jgi:hypothetical protein